MCNGMAIKKDWIITEPDFVAIQFDCPLIGWNLFRGHDL